MSVDLNSATYFSHLVVRGDKGWRKKGVIELELSTVQSSGFSADSSIFERCNLGQVA